MLKKKQLLLVKYQLLLWIQEGIIRKRWAQERIILLSRKNELEGNRKNPKTWGFAGLEKARCFWSPNSKRRNGKTLNDRITSQEDTVIQGKDEIESDSPKEVLIKLRERCKGKHEK